MRYVHVPTRFDDHRDIDAADGASLGVNPLLLNVAITSYLISMAVFIPISGWCADRFGPRCVFCGALVTSLLGSILCGLADSLPMLIGARVLQGMGGAMMTPVGRLILVRTFPKSQLVTAMNYVSMPALIGPIVGPLVGPDIGAAINALARLLRAKRRRGYHGRAA